MARQLQLNPYGHTVYPLAIAAVGDSFVVETPEALRSVRELMMRLTRLQGRRFATVRTTGPAGETYWVCTRVK
jgi:hypothetical protein